MNENLKNNALEASNQSAVINQLAAKLGYTIRDKHPTLVLCKEGYDDEQYPTAETLERQLIPINTGTILLAVKGN